MGIILVVLAIVVYSFFKKKQQYEDNVIICFVMKILTLILFTILYIFVIYFISLIPIGIIAKISNNSNSDGFWAYSFILGLGLAPIVSLITTNKLFNLIEDKEQINDNNTIKENKRNPIIIILIVIVSIISIGIILSSIFSFEKPKELSNEKDNYTDTLNKDTNINVENIKELEIQKNGESVYITEESLSRIDINYNERFFEYGWVLKRNGEQILARAIHPGEFTLNFKDLNDEFYKPTGNYEIYLEIYSQNEKKYVKASNSIIWYNE